MNLIGSRILVQCCQTSIGQSRRSIIELLLMRTQCIEYLANCFTYEPYLKLILSSLGFSTEIGYHVQGPCIRMAYQPRARREVTLQKPPHGRIGKYAPDVTWYIAARNWIFPSSLTTRFLAGARVHILLCGVCFASFRSGQSSPSGVLETTGAKIILG
jgi:hypothetical protein